MKDYFVKNWKSLLSWSITSMSIMSTIDYLILHKIEWYFNIFASIFIAFVMNHSPSDSSYKSGDENSSF